MTIVIADSTPLITLSAIGRFDLLRLLYQRIQIPHAVFNEVCVSGKGRPGATEVANANWIEVFQFDESKYAPDLHRELAMGEKQAISLAVQDPSSLLIIDDGIGRRDAQARGIKIIGTIGVLLQAKTEGLVSAVKPEFEKLKEFGFRFPEALYESALKRSGE